MEPTTNRQWRLARRPVGMVTPEDFEYAEEPVPEPGDGEVLVRNLYVSFDPAQRAFLNGRPGYAAPQPLGKVMGAGAVGQVVASRSSEIESGSIVVGGFGWQDYAVVTPAAAFEVDGEIPLTHHLSVLGGTGLTAYFGLVDVANVQSGDTVLVSAAAGATGSAAVQIAKLMGCRTIGIAGGPAKCSLLLDELGLDGAIDYKNEDLGQRLIELCPDGIDVYFDNVGGSTLEAAIERMSLHGRIALCGMISGYNDESPAPGPRNLFQMVSKRLTMKGFLVSDFMPRFEAARRELEGWVRSGQLKAFVDVQEGFENIPTTFMRIFSGANVGKQLLKIADPV